MSTTLIVTEKPDAALHVAEALGQGTPKKIYIDGVPLFEVHLQGERILVCSALGHLYGVAAKTTSGQATYPVWDFAWKPMHLVERGRIRQEKWIRAIAKASKQADRFVNACDFDVEGSLIGYTILKFACNGADRNAHRMKFSTLTETELQNAYLHPLPHLDFQLAFAGMCRHEVDWLFGINLSRALTQSAYRASGRYSTLSTGRVQGPTLRFVVEREEEIESFVPHPYWVLHVTVDIDGELYPAEYEVEKLQNKSTAEAIVHECAGQNGSVEKLDSNRYEISPPDPFDLSALQSESYRHLGLAPRASLELAERLYLDQLISYPRTSSEKLPASIGYARILKGLGQIENYRTETQALLGSESLGPKQGRKDDPAHPAVYPTGAIPKRKLEAREQSIFDLIVRRFLACFGKAVVRQSDKATILVNGHRFFLRGSRLIDRGWTAFYAPYAKFEDSTLPPLHVGQEVIIQEIKVEQKLTQPPPRYNPSSLLRRMEETQIGTKATRADIIETLYRRGYAKDERITATPLGHRIIEVLTKFCPKVIDVAFTRELEGRLEEIERGSQTKERVVEETVSYLEPIVESIKSNEKELGEELADLIAEMREEATSLSTPCPQCRSRIRIVKNPHTRKRFIGCSGKWKYGCNFTLPLPQAGTVTLLQRLCPECGFQLIRVRSRGRPALVSCCRCYADKRKVQTVVTRTSKTSESI